MVVVNVTGGSASLAAQEVSLTAGVMVDDVLWNFPSVPSVFVLARDVGGTILVPRVLCR